MSQFIQLKIIICVEIFFTFFNAIESQKLTFGKPYLEDNEAFHETVDESDFLSNIHTLMTPQELYRIFGTEDGAVPDYKVFPMNLRPSRNKRQTEERIKLTVEIDDQIIDLNLIATDGHLATKNIPVWLAHTDSRAYNYIRYDPHPQAMNNIEDIRMYQDLNNKAAIAVYTNSKHTSFMEGIVTPKYAVKSLPKRLSLDVIRKVSKYFLETPKLRKRSIKPDEDEITGHFVLFKIQQDTKHSPQIKPSFKSRTKRQSPIGAKRNIPETVYPEILLVLEHDVIRRQSITQALQFALAFWNGVDMIYSALNTPKIRLHIAGIIISADDEATPYIATDTSFNVVAQASDIPDKMGLYFHQEKNRFPMNLYDIVIAMTTMKLCDKDIKPCTKSVGYTELGSACQWRHKTEILGTTSSVGIVNYNRMYGGVQAAVQQIAHLFGVSYDSNVGLSSGRDEDIMGRERTNLTWSKLNKSSFERYFSLKISQCLDNIPVPINVTEKVLPGQWLTSDGQCRNHGFYETCELPNVSSCWNLFCKAEGSDECVKTSFYRLRGSPCN